jgi:hypothetical protein
MFMHSFKSERGTHFEVSFLDQELQYRAAYVLYIESTDVFTDDKNYHFQLSTFSKDPLPEDIQASIQAYLTAQDQSILAVASVVSLSPSSFAIVGVS